MTPRPCLLCRGGQQPYSDDPYAAASSNNNNNNNYNYNYNPNSYNPQNPPQDLDHIFQETVQDRVDQWREEQIQYRDQAPMTEKSSLRDSKGRLKLMVAVGKGGRTILFGCLMWRNVMLMEMVDRTIKGRLKNVLYGFLVVLFLGNLAGVSAAVMGTSGHQATKRFKAILNLDKLVEIVLLCWYSLRLTFIPNKHAPKEVYIASILHSIFFLVQCQSFTRISWDDKLFGAFEAKPEADHEPPSNGSGPMNQHPVYNQNQNYQYTA